MYKPVLLFQVNRPVLDVYTQPLLETRSLQVTFAPVVNPPSACIVADVYTPLPLYDRTQLSSVMYQPPAWVLKYRTPEPPMYTWLLAAMVIVLAKVAPVLKATLPALLSDSGPRSELRTSPLVSLPCR